jgi:hypothetical protein
MDFLTANFESFDLKTARKVFPKHGFKIADDLQFVDSSKQRALFQFDFYRRMEAIVRGNLVILEEENITFLDWLVFWASKDYEGRMPLPSSLGPKDLMTLQSLPYAVLTCGRLDKVVKRNGKGYFDMLINMAMTPDHYNRLQFLCSKICSLFGLKFIIPEGLFDLLMRSINSDNVGEYFYDQEKREFERNDDFKVQSWDFLRGKLRREVDLDLLLKGKLAEFRLYQRIGLNSFSAIMTFSEGSVKRKFYQFATVVLSVKKFHDDDAKRYSVFKMDHYENLNELAEELGVLNKKNGKALYRIGIKEKEQFREQKYAEQWNELSRTENDVNQVITAPFRNILSSELNMPRVDRLHLKIFSLLKVVADHRGTTLTNLLSGADICDLGSWPGCFVQFYSAYSPKSIHYQHSEFVDKWVYNPGSFGHRRLDLNRFVLTIPAFIGLCALPETQSYDLVVGDAYDTTDNRFIYDENDVWSGLQAVQQDLLLASQFVFAVKNLKIGGTVIVKYFGQLGLAKLARGVIGDYARYFRHVILTKPFFSSSLNYERYLICSFYTGAQQITSDLFSDTLCAASAIYHKHLNFLRRRRILAYSSDYRVVESFSHNPVEIGIFWDHCEVSAHKFFKVDPKPVAFGYSGYMIVANRSDVLRQNKNIGQKLRLQLEELGASRFFAEWHISDMERKMRKVGLHGNKKDRLKQATDRGIGARMTDLRFNPFLYLIESRG